MLEGKTCTKCGSPDGEVKYGIRKMRDGTIKIRWNCRPCDRERRQKYKNKYLKPYRVAHRKTEPVAWDDKKIKAWNDRAKESRLRIVERLGI